MLRYSEFLLSVAHLRLLVQSQRSFAVSCDDRLHIDMDVEGDGPRNQHAGHTESWDVCTHSSIMAQDHLRRVEPLTVR